MLSSTKIKLILLAGMSLPLTSMLSADAATYQLRPEVLAAHSRLTPSAPVSDLFGKQVDPWSSPLSSPAAFYGGQGSNRLTQLRTDSLDLGWVSYFGSNSMPSEDVLEDLCIDVDDNLLVVGTSDFECLTIKFNSDGVELWRAIHPHVDDLDSYGAAVITDAAGNIFVAGFTGGPHDDADILILKYDASGTLVWESSFAGPAGENDIPDGIKLDAEGNIYIAATSRNENNNNDFMLLKLDPQGSILWSATHNGTGYADDYVVDMAIDSEGQVYIVGIANQEISHDDIMVIKYDSSGNQIYRTTYDAQIEDTDWPMAMTLDDLGRVYVTGVSAGYDGLFDFVTFKLNPDGSGAWSRRYSSAYLISCYAFDVALDSSDNVYIVGVDYAEPTGYDIITIKYDPQGNRDWTRRYSSPIDWATDQGLYIIVGPEQNITVTGVSESTDGTVDLALVKYDSLGAQLWTTGFATDPAGDDIPEGLECDGSGHLLIPASTDRDAEAENFLLVKLDPAGDLLWDLQENGSGNDMDAGVAIACDALSNVYVAGVKYSVETENDISLLKYDSTGSLLWSTDWNGAADRSDVPADLLVDAAGNVFLTGYTESATAGRDMVTQMYDTAGTLLWSVSYNGPGGNHDEGTTLGFDSQGNIIITGYSTGNFTNADYTTIKYDGLGNELWVARYVGPNYGSDLARDLAIDDAGNVFVTGNSYHVGFNQDYATLKYDGNGNQVWVARYNGPINLDDGAEAISLDHNGNVFVAGSSMEAGINLDYTTIKYSPGGTQEWIRHFDGSAHFDDQALALEVDYQGNVYVGGTSHSELTGIDIVVVKYSNSGSLQWEELISGDADGDDDLVAMILDGTSALYVGGQVLNGLSSYDFSTVKLDAAGSRLWTQEQSGGGHSWDEPQDLIVDVRGTLWMTGTNHHFYFAGYDWSRIMTLQYLQPEYPVGIQPALPAAYTLEQNYPNPFNPRTAIVYQLPESGWAELVIFDIRGRMVQTLVQDIQRAGRHEIHWDGMGRAGHQVGSGVYFCRLSTPNYSNTIKMVCLR